MQMSVCIHGHSTTYVSTYMCCVPVDSSGSAVFGLDA